MSKRQLKNIIFSGGGFKGWAYIGTIKALNETIEFKNIEHIIGVSIGSVFSLFYILKIDPQFILNNFLNSDLKSFFDIDLDSVIINQSIIEGLKYKNRILDIVKGKINTTTTFIELYNLTGILYTTCAFNIDNNSLDYFNKDLTPDIKVIDAIMASSALPILFPSYKINGDYYYDGGICNNCPCNLVDPSVSIAFNMKSIDNKSEYKLFNLILSITNNLNKLYIKNEEIIFDLVDSKFDNEVYNLNQSSETIFNLYMNGYKNTLRILTQQNF